MMIGGGHGGAGRRRARGALMSEINVTPLVDVMLVLLIIFMVAAPLLVTGVPLDLPSTKAAALPDPDDPVTVSVDAKGRVFVGEDEVRADALAGNLAILAARRPDARVLVRADRSVDYGRVLGVLGELAAAGLTKVSLVSTPVAAAPTAKDEAG